MLDGSRGSSSLRQLSRAGNEQRPRFQALYIFNKCRTYLLTAIRHCIKKTMN